MIKNADWQCRGAYLELFTLTQKTKAKIIWMAFERRELIDVQLNANKLEIIYLPLSSMELKKKTILFDTVPDAKSSLIRLKSFIKLFNQGNKNDH